MKGIGASQGYCLGVAFVKKELKKIEKRFAEDKAADVQRLEEAIAYAQAALEAECAVQSEKFGEDQAEIFKAHQLMLQDPELVKSMKDGIEVHGYAADFAVQETMDTFVGMFEAMDNPYFKERALDVKDICRRLIKRINRIEETLPAVDDAIVVIAKDLTPSDTAKLDLNRVRGFATAQGGDTSHSAIIARTMGIPAIMGVKNIDETVKTGAFIILDGFTGEVFVDPDEATVADYRQKLQTYEAEQQALMAFKDKASVTKCGKSIEIASNIASVEDVEKAVYYGADGVGLFRSEFLFMNRETPPTEAEQFAVYKAVLEGMGDKPVVIRTLDAGGDKMIPYLNIPEEMNPFLGYRAIRVCLDDTELFKTQLRALLRASAHGTLKVMYPMISSLEEVRRAKALLEEVRRELDAEGVAYDASVEQGIMIEVPAAAVISDILAKEVDFFSIGTNDLVQYTVAVDRMNEHIKALYTPYHPAVLRLIEQTIKSGLEAGIWVGMCGSVAGNPLLFPLLLAMGLTEFSMGPNQMLTCRKMAAAYTIDELTKHLDAVKQMATAGEIEGYLKTQFGV